VLFQIVAHHENGIAPVEHEEEGYCPFLRAIPFVLLPAYIGEVFQEPTT